MFISAACAIKKVESNSKGSGEGVGPNLEGQASLENWHLDWSLEGEWEVSKLKDGLQKKDMHKGFKVERVWQNQGI